MALAYPVNPKTASKNRELLLYPKMAQASLNREEATEQRKLRATYSPSSYVYKYEAFELQPSVLQLLPSVPTR